MSNRAFTPDEVADLTYRWNPTLVEPTRIETLIETVIAEPAEQVSPTQDLGLAEKITRDASLQTYCTVHYLVDRDRVDQAYRAYAYFRWLDDTLDGENLSQAERSTFVARQQALITRCYRGERIDCSGPEERLLVELIRFDGDPCSGLAAYIQNMMAVMAFDAQRRGRLITTLELERYTTHLATAVTEALHYFIGHDLSSPHTAERYLAATGAHIVHMLRDAADDNAAGYYNVPIEFAQRYQLDPDDIHSEAYRWWTRQRLDMARACFMAGRNYIREIGSWRCRIAAYAYIARFEGTLATIEQEGYQLRATYPDCKGWSSMLRLGASVLSMVLE